MNSKTLVLGLFAFSALLGACTPKNFSPKFPDTGKDASFGNEGGTPGTISVSGAVVNENGLDSRITIEQHAGRSKTGDLKTFKASSTVVLKREVGKESLFTEPSAGTLLNVGCDANQVSQFVGQQNLKAVEPVKNLKAVSTTLTAEVVMLCGEIEFQTTLVAINADTLILSGLNYSQTDVAGVSRFSTNHLLIAGANRLSAISKDFELPEILGTSISLEVLKSFEAAPGATLRLSSQGSTYKKIQ